LRRANMVPSPKLGGCDDTLEMQPTKQGPVVHSVVSAEAKHEQALLVEGEEILEKDDSSHDPSSLHSTTCIDPHILVQEQPHDPLSIESFTHDGVQHSSSNPTFNLLHPILPPATMSSPSIISHGSSMEPGVDSFRRFIRSRASARTRTTAESSSQRSTQSLGDEDSFAYATDEPIHSGSDHSQPQRRDAWDVECMHPPLDSVPPIVWEESSDSDRGERRRPEPAPNNNNSNGGNSRLRGFLLPAVRRRGGRQSSSVRRHLPGSSSSSAGTSIVASPLSETAAAVLFTSSQASIDSINDYAVPPHSRRGIATQATREPSASTFDDSAVETGVSTHRSTLVDVGGIDALSISTVGNSIMAPSEAVGLGDSGRQSFSTSRNDVVSRQQQMQNRVGASPPSGRNEHGTAADTNQADPNREARIRWIRINRRFQLMLTCVSVLFTMVLFSILVGWIVLTSAYVVTFGGDCDVPLRLFYWMVTLQLVLDVFRQDIMRYVLRWNPAQNPSVPNRVVAYNIAYLAYALLVLRLGVECVYAHGQAPDSTCRTTSPELFQASLVFVTLILAAWATLIFGYIIPFCVVASILTRNGYNPSDDQNNAGNAGGVFSTTNGNIGSPPGTVEQMQEVDLDVCRDSCPQECCICMEDFCADEAIVITDCEHILHKDCMSVCKYRFDFLVCPVIVKLLCILADIIIFLTLKGCVKLVLARFAGPTFQMRRLNETKSRMTPNIAKI
jgi:hypothetical protein